jgi:hypothetical protein
MPNLAQLTNAGSDPLLTIFTTTINVVEPLDGPTSIDDVMDRFPEEVYQQGRDTHLYRFMQALGGDSGAGFIKKQVFSQRLMFEAEFINFQVLDDFYAAQFRFNRLLPETYTFNVAVDALTPTQWDQVQLGDQSYRHRIADFFTATRYGNSPMGMAVMTQAGSGIQSDIVEHYRYIYDQYSDSPLGITPEGTMVSTAEFVAIPRFLNATDDVFDQDYEQTHAPRFTFTPPVLDPAARPVPAPTGGDKLSVAQDYYPDPQTRLRPEIERNAIDLLDRLRSVTTVATIQPDDIQYISVPINGDPVASTERIHVSRLVEGKTGVVWPELDTSENYFVQTGVENEAGYYYGSQRDLPVIFHTLEGTRAYTEQALVDPVYGSNDFFDASSGISPYQSYASEHYGRFGPTISAIFPFLANVTSDASFKADYAVAITNTPLVLEGRAT